MFKHCYMPQSMINSVFVPLVKKKSDDLTDKNNCKPMALSSIASKVFEHVIIDSRFKIQKTFIRQESIQYCI